MGIKGFKIHSENLKLFFIVVIIILRMAFVWPIIRGHIMLSIFKSEWLSHIVDSDVYL